MSDTITRKLMLFFPNCDCEQPIIYHLVKDYDLLVNVFRAKVTPREEGYLVLDVTGTPAQIDRALAYLNTFDVKINFTGKGVAWDSDRCTHCGHCLPYCPTQALHIADPVTREVGFDESKCVECMACITACPFGACSSAF